MGFGKAQNVTPYRAILRIVLSGESILKVLILPAKEHSI